MAESGTPPHGTRVASGSSGIIPLSLDVTAVPRDPVGAGQYTIKLAQALAQRSDVDLLLIARRKDGSRWRALVPDTPLVTAAPDLRPLRLAWEQTRLPALLKGHGVGVHHGPHYTMPERSKVPTVVTIHDLSFFEEPEWHERSKAMLFRRAIRIASERAAAVVCPSRSTAAQLGRWCKVSTEVFVAHHGVDTARFSPEEPSSGSDVAALATVDARLVTEGRRSDRPMLLFVGTLEPRKDVPTLVGAFDRVAAQQPDALLVLAGGAGWGAGDVDRAVAQTNCADRIIRTGYVGDDVVPALLRAATAAVYPALYEGFGLPALEALACGTPLVTTSGTAMEEVAGEAGIYVPPGDLVALTDALHAVLSGAELGEGGSGAAARRRLLGLEIVGRHTWEASAVRHIVAYRHSLTLNGRA